MASDKNVGSSLEAQLCHSGDASDERRHPSGPRPTHPCRGGDGYANQLPMEALARAQRGKVCEGLGLQ